MELKGFQKRTLGKLGDFLNDARLRDDCTRAFATFADERDGQKPEYHEIPGLEGVPYVCLRLPTGGGKTILAASAIKVAADKYLDRDFPVVLWLVPSKTIREQTAKALKDSTHPYREVLDQQFRGKVRVFESDQIGNLQPQDIQQNLCIVVATMQTSRVADKEIRDLYADKEALEKHFKDARVDALPGLDRYEDGRFGGRVKYSFANLMRVQRPLMIIDEAHNARTPLTFETLARMAPSCIVELTATPDVSHRTGSNVLCRVSAGELKSEAMIKLPVVLTEHPLGWEDAVSEALRTRERLAVEAAEEERAGGQYIRPILLIQAENQDKPANVEVVKKYLLEKERIPVERIAVATGNQRELDGVDLFSRKALTEVILTVQALKEGWDCSFAYVFCSVANVHATTSVEQLLGRVLRMPYAAWRTREALNKAYAHVASASFRAAALQLEQSMVKLGFDASEAARMVERSQPKLAGLAPEDWPPLTLYVSERPDLKDMAPAELANLTLVPEPDGRTRIVVQPQPTEHMVHVLIEATPMAEREDVARELREFAALPARKLSPSERLDEFAVPQLCVWMDQQLELFDETLVEKVRARDLETCPADLSEFRYSPDTHIFELDVEGEHIKTREMGGEQLDLNISPVPWTENDLIGFLDSELHSIYLRQENLLAWLQRALRSLLQSGKFDLATLVRGKYLLKRALEWQLIKCSNASRSSAFQELLFEPQAAPVTTYEYSFSFDPRYYPASWFCTGSHEWQRHFYPVPGELRGRGDEYGCAVALDTQPEVKYWVRNLAKREGSFRLPTETGYTYPDFVAELVDGRSLAIEYKGAHISENPKELHKGLCGEVWERSSKGKALYLYGLKRDSAGRDIYRQIRDKIAGA